MLPLSFKNYFKYEKSLDFAGNYLMYKEDEAWPLLFLYSKTDILMPHTFVTKVIGRKKHQNPQRFIESELFEKSSHVAHLRKYPEEYKKNVAQFLLKSRL